MNMATESPIRIPSHGEAVSLAPSTHNMAIEDLGLHRKGQNVRANRRDTIPNRSDSAPPSMEGSFLAINNLISQQNASLNQSVGSGTMQNSDLNKLSHTAYYDANVNPNAGLPTPPIPKENRHSGHHFGGIWRITSTDNINKSSFNSQVTLSTHKEELEDDQSPQQPCDDMVDRTNRFWAVGDAGPLVGKSKSSVDLIQQDFPRTPSPVYNLSHSLSSVTTDEPVDSDGNSGSLHDYSVSTSNAVASTTSKNSVRLPMNADHSSSPISSTSSLNYAVQPTPFVNKGTPNVAHLATVDSGVKNLNIASFRMSKDPTIQDQWHQSYQSHLPQHQFYQQQTNPFQIHTAKPQMGSQAANSAFVGMDHYLHGTSKFSTEVQPALQSSGFTSPLYTTAATCMTPGNPYYAKIQAPGLYPPQYGTSGYPSNSGSISPFITGYPPNTPIPVVFDGPTAPNFGARISGPSSGASVAPGAEMQQFNNFYGQLGYAVHTSFADPTYMPFYHHPFGPAFNVAGHFDPLMSGGVFVGGQNFLPESKRGSEVTSVSDDQKSQNQRAGVSNPRNVRGVMMDPHYFGNPPNMGIVMQSPPSPLATPVLCGSVASGPINSGGRSEIRFSPGTDRYPAIYSGWHSPRSMGSYNDPKIYNFLEELKSGKGRRFELSDIMGHIVEFSSDQHGSRFIQQKLECCSTEEKATVFKEVLPYASKLMTDVFGNYVIQKFFEYGSLDQRKELANQLTGQILPLSLQMYGCRVIQKVLDVIELDHKVQLVRELDGHVIQCVRDQNGNHVIQKCIESVPAEKIGFIISAFCGQVAILSMHPYGCRVIQRVLEHCTDELHFQFIVDEILASVCTLAQDQYGNYVTQHVLERGKSRERVEIISRLSGQIVQLSQHKFASNVIEKCLVYGGASERESMIDEILGQNEGSDNLLTMMKDQFANYVVQKILDTCTESQRAMLLNRIQLHLHALKKYTYGKHIVGRFEHEFGEDHPSSRVYPKMSGIFVLQPPVKPWQVKSL